MAGVIRWLWQFTGMVNRHAKNAEELVWYCIAPKLLAGIIRRRLFNTREMCMLENQASFCPGRGCIDQISTLWRFWEHRRTFCRPTISTFFDLKTASDSVDWAAPWYYLSLKSMPEKFISLTQSLYASSQSRVHAYGNLPPEFTTRSYVRHSCCFSPSPLGCLWKQPYFPMRIVTGFNLNYNMGAIPYYWENIQVNFGCFSIIWMIVYLCLGCIFHLRSVNCCFKTIGSNLKLLLEGVNWMRWTNLATWVILSHLVVLYRLNFHCTYKRPDCHLLAWGICDVGVTPSYRSKVDYTKRQWGRCCFRAPKLGH